MSSPSPPAYALSPFLFLRAAFAFLYNSRPPPRLGTFAHPESSLSLSLSHKFTFLLPFILNYFSLIKFFTMTTRKRKQEAEEELQALPSDVSEEEEE